MWTDDSGVEQSKPALKYIQSSRGRGGAAPSYLGFLSRFAHWCSEDLRIVIAESTLAWLRN